MKSTTIVAMISVMAILASSMAIVMMSDESDAASTLTVTVNKGDSSWSVNGSNPIEEFFNASSLPLLSKSDKFVSFGYDGEEMYDFDFSASSGSTYYYPTSLSYTSSSITMVFSVPSAGDYVVRMNFALNIAGYTEGSGYATKTYTISPYTVVFNGNGATTTSVAVSPGDTCKLPSITRSGYIFNGWYTAASGGAFVGNAGDTYSPSGDITLYAHWTAATINITSASGATDMVKGKTYSHTLTSNISGCTVSISGASWLTANGYTISGVPPTAGDYNVTVTLSKTGYTSASQTFTIHVAEVLSFTSSPSAGIIISG